MIPRFAMSAVWRPMEDAVVSSYQPNTIVHPPICRQNRQKRQVLEWAQGDLATLTIWPETDSTVNGNVAHWRYEIDERNRLTQFFFTSQKGVILTRLHYLAKSSDFILDLSGLTRHPKTSQPGPDNK
jgi:hypothetical protein